MSSQARYYHYIPSNPTSTSTSTSRYNDGGYHQDGDGYIQYPSSSFVFQMRQQQHDASSDISPINIQHRVQDCFRGPPGSPPPVVEDVTAEYPKIIELCLQLSTFQNGHESVKIVLDFLLPLLKDRIHQKLLLQLLRTELTPLPREEKKEIQAKLSSCNIHNIHNIHSKSSTTSKSSYQFTLPKEEWNRTNKSKVLKASTNFKNALQFLFLDLVKNKTVQSILEKTPLVMKEHFETIDSDEEKIKILKTLRRFLSLWKRDMAPFYIGNPFDAKWYDVPGHLSSLYAYLITSPAQKKHYQGKNKLQHQINETDLQQTDLKMLESIEDQRQRQEKKKQKILQKEKHILLMDIDKINSDLFDKNFITPIQYSTFNDKYREYRGQEVSEKNLQKIKKLLQQVSKKRLSKK
jgi:hypothetical protein